MDGVLLSSLFDNPTESVDFFIIRGACTAHFAGDPSDNLINVIDCFLHCYAACFGFLPNIFHQFVHFTLIDT